MDGRSSFIWRQKKCDDCDDGDDEFMTGAVSKRSTRPSPSSQERKGKDAEEYTDSDGAFYGDCEIPSLRYGRISRSST